MTPPTILRGKGAPKAFTKEISINVLQESLVPSNILEECHNLLAAALADIFAMKRLTVSKERLYRSVESICLCKQEDRLFRCLQEQSRVHIQGLIGNILDLKSRDHKVMHLLVHFWKNLTLQFQLIRKIFLYLDRTFLASSESIHSIWEMALTLLMHILESESCRVLVEDAVAAVLESIHRERTGEKTERENIRVVLEMLNSLNLYSQELETPLFSESHSFYESESAKFIETVSISDYLKHVEKRLSDESERSASLLFETPEKALLAVVEEEMVQKHVETLLGQEFWDLLDRNAIDDLYRLYFLLARVNALEPVKRAYSEYLHQRGKDFILDEANDDVMVEKMLSLKRRNDTFIVKAFGNNVSFLQASRDTFKRFINERKSAPAEYIAKYFDKILRAGNTIYSEESISTLLDELMILFRYINGKDVFEAFYKKDLAKRLLLNQSASKEFEKLAVSKLCEECGKSFTKKLEGMFTDMDVSVELETNFRAFKEQSIDDLPEIDLNINVLTMGNWPSYPPFEIYIPPTVKILQNAFVEFYLGLAKHNGRKISWQSSLAHCELGVRFPSGKKILLVSACQAAILLQFNSIYTATFKQLAELTLLDAALLKLNLHSLLSVKILQKKSKTDEITETDIFRVNKKFSSKQIRIRVNEVQMKETAKERTDTNERVDQDRQYQIDATIVRIMKSKKTLSHTLLIAEAITQLKFPVTVPDLKKRIASLIERDYIERDEESAQIYNYVA